MLFSVATFYARKYRLAHIESIYPAHFLLVVVLVGVSVLTLGIGLLLTVPAGVLLALAAAAIAVTWLVCSIIATVRAFNGEPYRYPLCLRLVG